MWNLCSPLPDWPDTADMVGLTDAPVDRRMRAALRGDVAAEAFCCTGPAGPGRTEPDWWWQKRLRAGGFHQFLAGKDGDEVVPRILQGLPAAFLAVEDGAHGHDAQARSLHPFASL